MAKFKFRHAVMTAGKSQDLIRVYNNYNRKGEKVLVLTPTTDNRDGVGSISSRCGDSIEAVSVNPGELRKWISIYFEESKNEDKSIVCILMDEVQFFTRDDIHGIKELALISRNIPIIAYGLKNDFQNNLFEGSAACIVVAEKIEEIETVCAFCNNRATMNLRFNDGKPVHTGEQILIGDDEYKPVCHKHYLQVDLEI